MNILPLPPRKLRIRFSLSWLGGGALLLVAGALGAWGFGYGAVALCGSAGERIATALIAFFFLLVARVGVLRIFGWRLARLGEETVVRGRPAIRFRKRVIVLRMDGYPLQLTPDELERLRMHKLVNDIHSC